MIVQVKDKQFRPYINAQQISEQIAKLADRLNEDYKEKIRKEKERIKLEKEKELKMKQKD